MKTFLIFIGGFVAGILTTILFIYLISVKQKTNDGLIGLEMFSKKGECITSAKKNKSCEIKIFQVLAPNAALGNINYYSDKKIYGGDTYRSYDIGEDVVVLLINYEDKTYYDDQKFEVSNKCVRQIGTYQYQTKRDFEKTVPVVVIE